MGGWCRGEGGWCRGEDGVEGRAIIYCGHTEAEVHEIKELYNYSIKKPQC